MESKSPRRRLCQLNRELRFSTSGYPSVTVPHRTLVFYEGTGTTTAGASARPCYHDDDTLLFSRIPIDYLTEFAPFDWYSTVVGPFLRACTACGQKGTLTTNRQ